MFPPKQRMLLLTINGRAFLAPADYRFQVHGQGQIYAADLRAGDQVRNYDDQDAIIEAIIDMGAQPCVCYMGMEMPPFYQAGMLLPGSLVATSDGCKRIEDLRPGDRILSGEADTPAWA